MLRDVPSFDGQQLLSYDTWKLKCSTVVKIREEDDASFRGRVRGCERSSIAGDEADRGVAEILKALAGGPGLLGRR